MFLHDVLSDISYEVVTHPLSMVGDETLCNAIIGVLGCIAVFCIILYLPRIVYMRDCLRKARRVQACERRKISLVIPARDESSVIGELFASIRTQDYDRSCFDVNVIV